jgi:hypothetical protein
MGAVREGVPVTEYLRKLTNACRNWEDGMYYWGKRLGLLFLCYAQKYHDYSWTDLLLSKHVLGICMANRGDQTSAQLRVNCGTVLRQWWCLTRVLAPWHPFQTCVLPGACLPLSRLQCDVYRPYRQPLARSADWAWRIFRSLGPAGSCLWWSALPPPTVTRSPALR